MPAEFYDDFVRIASEEAAHFQSWARRLEEMGSSYGALPCHDGLWDDAHATSDDLLARFALVHMVHEARGLDVFPASRQVCAADIKVVFGCVNRSFVPLARCVHLFSEIREFRRQHIGGHSGAQCTAGGGARWCGVEVVSVRPLAA